GLVVVIHRRLARRCRSRTTTSSVTAPKQPLAKHIHKSASPVESGRSEWARIYEQRASIFFVSRTPVHRCAEHALGAGRFSLPRPSNRSGLVDGISAVPPLAARSQDDLQVHRLE